MASEEPQCFKWAVYLKAVRAEVLERAGIFGEDDDLRALFEECFAQGNELTGTVLWSDDSSATLSRCALTSERSLRSCFVVRTCTNS
jgi:hypothetical protein